MRLWLQALAEADDPDVRKTLAKSFRSGPTLPVRKSRRQSVR